VSLLRMRAKGERRLALKTLAKQRPPCPKGTNKISDDVTGHRQCHALFTMEHLQDPEWKLRQCS
jgi:hypothetical protein